MSLHYVTLTGKLPGCAGARFKLEPESWVVAPSEATTFPPRTIEGTLKTDHDGNGVIGGLGIDGTQNGIEILATDNADESPTGWTWTITWYGIPGVPPESTEFLAPANGQDGVTIDVASITPVVDPTQVTNMLLALNNLVDVANPATALANIGGVPIVQSFPLANQHYRDISLFTVTGQTDDPLAPFGQVAGSQTYSFPPDSGLRAVQGPAVWTGYNPRKLSGQGSLSAAENAHGSLGMAWFADAGDSNDNAGGHGLEFSIGCFFSPDRSQATNSIEVVALDDNTNTVSTAFRCGSGQYTGPTGIVVSSGFSFTDAGGGSYIAFGPYALAGSPGIITNNPITSSNMSAWNATSPVGMAFNFTSVNASAMKLRSTTGASSLTIQADSNATANLFLNGNSSAGSSGTLAFQKAGANTWVFQESGSSNLYVLNNSGNVQMLLNSGVNTAGNYDLAATYMLSKVLVYGSLVVNNGGANLANAATKGFIYLPAVSGPPTGVPAANVGSVAACYDIVNNKINVYNGGWKASAALS